MNLRRTTLVCWTLGLLQLIACNGGGPEGEPPPACGEDPIEVEVGTGLDAFVAMPGGADLPFFHGPQGGYHVYGSVRTRGFAAGDPSDPFDPSHPWVTYRLTWNGQVVALVAQARKQGALGDGWEGTTGQLVVIALVDPLVLEGQPVELEALVSDRCGASGSDLRTGVMRFAGDVG